MSLRIILDPSYAAMEIKRLPPATKRRVREAIKNLADDPTGMRHALDVKELEPTQVASRAFRLRVGDWRVVYLVEPKVLRVMRIFPRSEGYGWMERRP